MTPSQYKKFVFSAAILLACAAIPAFAQRGGGFHGGGGGGFHGGGGGGFHGGGSGGGGFHTGGGSGGGGFHSVPSSPPRMGGGYSRSMPSVPPRSWAGSSAGPGGNSYRPRGGSVGEGQTQRYSSVRPSADGQWHSFGGTVAGRESARPFSGARSAVSTGWQAFGASRSVDENRSTRSFSGQGRNIWENAPMARNVVPRSRALSNIRGSFTNSLEGNSRLRSSGTSFSSSRFATSSAFRNRTILDSSRGNGFGGFQNRHRPAFPFGFREGFGRGCWNCGFGWSFGFGWWPGWGFGWPWLNYWDSWGPSWIDPVWGWPGYGSFGYPLVYSHDYSYDDSYSYSAPPENDTDSDAGAPPVEQGATTSGSNEEIVAPVLLYMKDGSVYSVSGYGIEDGRLHYILTNGAENTVNLDQVDIQRTVNENAKSGVRVTLKPRPGLSTPSPTAPATKPQNDVI
jgi:hypothetical protein